MELKDLGFKEPTQEFNTRVKGGWVVQNFTAQEQCIQPERKEDL